MRNIGEYQFRDVIEGFNSYLDRDELGISRNEVLENIQNLENLLWRMEVPICLRIIF